MNMNHILTKVSATIKQIGFALKKNSPKIMTYTGVAGVVAGGVLACRATLKLPEVLDASKLRMDDVHKNADPMSEKKELTVAYMKTGLDLAKLYAPSVGLGALSILCVLGGSNILTKRNAALAAAYTTLDAGFKEYRNRVVAKYGTEAEKALRYSVHEEKIEETVVDENGKTKKVKKSIEVSDINQASDYARFYDAEYSKAWADDHDYNLMFLKAQQNLANNLLIANGYLFLNDVYTMLGIDRSIPGQVVGWIYDRHNEDTPVGDNYVDFGIAETHRRDDHGELMPTIRLDFNVDGNIWERAQKKNLLTA